MKLVPSEQFDQRFSGTLNLHPKGARYTKKRNPIVPVIAPLADLMARHDGAWLSNYRPHQVMHRWKLLRQDLGLGPDVVGNTIRHTIASQLMWRGAKPAEISELLGHREARGSMARHRHYDPSHLASVTGPLTDLWNEVHAEADRWCERYAVITMGNGRKRVLPRRRLEEVDGELSRLRCGDWVSPHHLARALTLHRDVAGSEVWPQIKGAADSIKERQFFRYKNIHASGS